MPVKRSINGALLRKGTVFLRLNGDTSTTFVYCRIGLSLSVPNPILGKAYVVLAYTTCIINCLSLSQPLHIANDIRSNT